MNHASHEKKMTDPNGRLLRLPNSALPRPRLVFDRPFPRLPRPPLIILSLQKRVLRVPRVPRLYLFLYALLQPRTVFIVAKEESPLLAVVPVRFRWRKRRRWRDEDNTGQQQGGEQQAETPPRARQKRARKPPPPCPSPPHCAPCRRAHKAKRRIIRSHCRPPPAPRTSGRRKTD